MDATDEDGSVRRVLVVDDDDDIREVAQVALSVVGGWQVSTATNGREAVEAATRDLPDAILLDVMMPEMDGPTAVLVLRRAERTRDIPIILLTAKVQTRDHLDWTGLELAGVIPKPFDPMTLPGQMSQMLGWSD